MSPQMLISVLVISILLFACEAIPSAPLKREARSVNDPANQVKRYSASGETKKVTITDDRIEVVVSGGESSNSSQILWELNSIREVTKTMEKQLQAMDKRLQALEKLSSNDFSFIFPKIGVTDYILNQGMTSLKAVTGCFWMRSNANTRGTPFSYSVSGQDNELVLYNYKNFYIIVGGDWSSASSVSANDGLWHHICFTWENTAGSWYIFKDGSQRASGAGLKKGYAVRAGGILLLGQEQDSFGGSLDATQSFVGTLSHVNVWNRALAAQEIFKLSKSCHAGEGNVLKSTDFKSGVRGSVQVIHPSSCKS